MITVNRTALNNALKLILPVTAKTGALPICNTVRIEVCEGRLLLAGTDLDTSVVTELEVAGNFDGPLAAPARLLASIIGAAKGDTVNLEHVDGTLKVTSERSNFELLTMLADDFPETRIAEGEAVTLDADTRSKIAGILYAASRDGSRPILTGVGLSDGWAACTDSYRLAATEIGGTLPTCIIPARAFELVGKNATGTIDLLVDGRRASFRAANATWTSRLIEGTYPNWRTLIPESTPQSIVVDREALAGAVGRVGVLNGEAPVRLEASEGGLRVWAQVQDVGAGTETVPAETDVEGVIAFNSRYLADLLHHSGDEAKVVIGVTDVQKPVIVKTGDLTSLLMSVRVS
jgi:DNA polymerase-3 subunit beta